VDELGLEDVAVIAWDARGHGKSPGERGHADNFACIVKDIDVFVRHIAQEHLIPLENMVVLGHSVGAVAVRLGSRLCSAIRAHDLGDAGLPRGSCTPFAIPGLRIWQAIKAQGVIKSYVKANMLTHDRSRPSNTTTDPLDLAGISRSISCSNLFDTSTRLMDDAGAIRVPTLLWPRIGLGGQAMTQRRFFDAWSLILRDGRLCGFFHALLHEGSTLADCQSPRVC